MRRFFFPAYLFVISIFMISILEIGSFYILKSEGSQSNLFYQEPKYPQGRDPGRLITYSTLDPHLGYTHGKNDSRIQNLNPKYRWRDGFLIYDDRENNFERPIILTLGGSTTDGIQVGHSWPEELSKLLKLNNLKGTVINGGIGGYSTNQELIKLIRDGVEFKPDIVISYSGVNDRGDYSKLPYPMTHTYQRAILGALTGENPSILPNTIKLINKFIASNYSDTYGLSSDRSLPQQYQKNIELMNAVCIWAKCRFHAFIQPVAFYNSIHGKNSRGKDIDYRNSVVDLYKEIVLLPQSHDYIFDATGILENSENVYTRDGVHLNEDGDRIVGEFIFNFLRKRNDL